MYCLLFFSRHNHLLWYLSSLVYYVIFCVVSVCEDDSGDEGPVPQEDRALTQGVLKTLASKLDDLSTCNELIGKHGAALQRSLSELEDLRGSADSTDRVKAVNERATLFRITSNAMINVSSCEASITGDRSLFNERSARIFWLCVACVHTSGLSWLSGRSGISQPEVAEDPAAWERAASPSGGDHRTVSQTAQQPGESLEGESNLVHRWDTHYCL